MDSGFDFITVGDNCIDRFEGGRGLDLVGGNAVNVAVQLSLLGHRVAYFGAIGDDEDGQTIIRVLQSVGVCTDYVRIVDAVTAYSLIRHDETGDRDIYFEEFGASGIYAPTAEDVSIMQKANHEDLNPKDLDIAILSAGSPSDGHDKGNDLIRSGARMALVTMGALGSMVFSGSEIRRLAAKPIEAVDTTGAGDAFIAGFLSVFMQDANIEKSLINAREVATKASLKDMLGIDKSFGLDGHHMNLKIKATLVAAFCIVGGIGQSQTMDIFQSLELDDPAALAIVINQTSDLEAQNVQGDTAVITAARLGNLVAIEALVNAGADINALDRNKRDILNIAITTQNIDLARHALSLGADPTLVTSVYDGGAIIYGSAKGAVEIVEMLIAAGAPVNRVNNLGWTALLEVAILGDGSQALCGDRADVSWSRC
ncbi:Fructosamine kinase FrlD [Nymphon striatum]|nr:Fructosamine kinase FrlD [Nymphon striatum]